MYVAYHTVYRYVLTFMIVKEQNPYIVQCHH